LRVALFIVQIVEDELWWTGVRHLASDEMISKYVLLLSLNSIYKNGSNIIPTEASQTVYRGLRTDFAMPSIYEQLQELYTYHHPPSRRRLLSSSQLPESTD
jgi:hypothetical protein